MVTSQQRELDLFMLRLLFVLTAITTAVAVECPGTWQDRAAPPIPGPMVGRRLAVTLADGRVLVVGREQEWVSAVYDPFTDTWSAPVPLPLLPMPNLHSTEGSTAPDPPDALVVSPESLTAMPDGSAVAIADAGRFRTGDKDQQPEERVIMAALHWSAGAWSVGGTLEDSRGSFAAARLGEDRIVAVGGLDFRGSWPGSWAVVYDVPTRSWRPVLSGDWFPGPGMTATRLADGRVLALSGSAGMGWPLADAFLISVDGSAQMTTPMTEARVSLIAERLPDGRVLAAGAAGYAEDGSINLPGAEIFDPFTATWTTAASPPAPTWKSTTLSDGRVFALTDGGAVVFDPASGTWCTTAAPPTESLNLVATPDGAIIGISPAATYRFTFDRSAPLPTGSLDITEIRWDLVVEADAVRIDGSVASAAGDGWEATTALPGAADHVVRIEWTAGNVTRTATATASEVVVPLGDG